MVLRKHIIEGGKVNHVYKEILALTKKDEKEKKSGGRKRRSAKEQPEVRSAADALRRTLAMTPPSSISTSAKLPTITSPSKQMIDVP